MASITILSPDDLPESPTPRPSKIQDATRKWCSRCELYVPRTEFSQNKKTRDGLGSYCRPCMSAPAQVSYDRSARRAAHVKRYGLTLKQFEVMHKRQGRVCAICKSSDHRGRNWHIDHDHETGKVRGILCYLCNYMLGGARDLPDTLRAGAEYLEKHGK